MQHNDKNKKRNDMDEKLIDLMWEVKEGKKHPNRAYKELCILFNVSPCCYLNELLYYKENEGTAKTFRNIRTEKWYYEAELAEIIGIKNIDKLKSNKG